MANMSYCRFENTSSDLEDCLEALREYGSIEDYINDKDPSSEEVRSIYKLIELAQELVDEFDD